MSLIDYKYMWSKTPEESKLGHGNQRPEIELARVFMPVLITSSFDDDSIKNESTSMETPFCYYGKFLDAQGQLTT